MKLIDLKRAYLNLTIRAEVKAIDPIQKAISLHKAFYGLKKSGKQWYEMLKMIFLDINFTVLKLDPCIFEHKDLQILALVNVHDCERKWFH